MVRAGRLAAALLLALCLAGLALTPAAAAQAAPGAYTNPVSRDFADTFADPAVIKAKDGYSPPWSRPIC